MKTPHLDNLIESLEKTIQYEIITPKFRDNCNENLKELKAIKQLIENSPIVSTPDKPVWVVDESGYKRILLADLGEKVIDDRFILVSKKYNDEFLSGKGFEIGFRNQITPYTPKVNIEVTEDEAVKVEEFLKTLRK